MLTAVLQRQLVAEKRLVRLRIDAPDTAGTLGLMCSEIGHAGGNINSVVHDRTFLSIGAKSVRVEVEVEFADPAALAAIERRLSALGLVVASS